MARGTFFVFGLLQSVPDSKGLLLTVPGQSADSGR